MEKKIVSAIGKLGFVVFLVIFPHFVPLPFYSYALVCFGAIFLMLRKEGKTFRDIGLIKGKFTSRAIILGVFTGLTWVAFMQFVYIPSIKYFFEVSDYTEYNFIKSNMTMLIMTVFAAIVIGGFYEEIVFRGYIQSVFEKRIFKGFNPLISMLLTSLLFGIYHVQQDIFAVIAAFMGGMYWAILSKKFGNLWIPIISHALFDTVTLILIYKGAFGAITY
ncbi:CPBP family intramembrane metalloprotease [Sphingobacterium sp. ML3W]|uniref:CPBP family intramembrane glutamic endopeptidase n=1 Tax=Sphingobacterium sp. ML3W TaxID=1538644 RepID=UPI00249BDB39|nr:CPBP family intramembrane glutamic endopeptidase [Sphingobacterium sp. ML3W]WFA81010.1 CPBP family intramembrane metalloprotease [Sphingobacterium sp. ML3W]